MKATDFFQKLRTLDKEDLVSIDGIGEVLADNYLEFLSSENKGLRVLKKFEDLESEGVFLNIQSGKSSVSEGSLAGDIVCITGSFDISRPKIKENLEAQGAKVTNTVSSNTTILLAGEKPGSKLQKAESLGIKVVKNLDDILLN